MKPQPFQLQSSTRVKHAHKPRISRPKATLTAKTVVLWGRLKNARAGHVCGAHLNPNGRMAATSYGAPFEGPHNAQSDHRDAAVAVGQRA